MTDNKLLQMLLKNSDAKSDKISESTDYLSLDLFISMLLF